MAAAKAKEEEKVPSAEAAVANAQEKRIEAKGQVRAKAAAKAKHDAEALKIRPGAPFLPWAAAILRYKDMEHLKRLVKPLASVLYAGAGKR